MIGFFIKKAFYDGWDNLLQIILLNVVIVLFGAGGIFLAQEVSTYAVLSIGIMIAVFALEGIIMMAVSEMMARIADFKSFTFMDLLKAVRGTWLHGLFYALLCGGIFLVFTITMPYYAKMGSLFGFVLAVMIFWIAVITVLAIQWFLPIRSQLEKNFLKAIKKCFIIFFDNPGFSLFMFFYTVIVLLLSCVMVLIVPGFAGTILAHNDAFRLRMYKYDWIEKNPALDFKTARKTIPWEELLAEDDEIVGKRTLRSFFFPWKY